MTKPMTPQKRILKVARQLIKNGWCRNVSSKKVNGNMHYCMTGAVKAASRKLNLNDWETHYSTYNALKKLKKLTEERGATSIVDFNDYHAKDKRTVLRIMDKAIESA